MLFLPLFILFEPYTLTLSLFERALAFHNFLAFFSFFLQWRGLISSRGIAPVAELMQKLKQRGWTFKTRWKVMPTLFWYRTDDDMIYWVQMIGMISSACAFFGILSGLNILIACICYTSIKNVGSVFTQLQLHAHIVEIDILYIVCAPFLHVAPSAFVVLASLLNFRVMMGGGAGKWFGGDRSWRDGTAMSFHYWTQPLPNPISPFMHRLPQWVHKCETYASIIFESGAACFVFAPVWLRVIPFVGFMSLMLLINLTGNFAQISVLTMNETILLLNDNYWHAILNIIPGMHYLESWLVWTHSIPYLDYALCPTKNWYSVWNISLTLIPYLCFILPYSLIHLIPLIGTFRGHNALEFFEAWTTKPLDYYKQYVESETYTKYIQPYWEKLWKVMEKAYLEGSNFELFSSYVKFGHMTKFRHEIIIESSVDGSNWEEYEFKYKPSKVTNTPPFCPGHLPCIDWRLWFLPLEFARGGREAPAWFVRILTKLLECEPCVMALFKSVPYDGIITPKPRFIRAQLYDYRFAWKYEKEDEMKLLVKERRIRDTEIDTSSEEEIEVDVLDTPRTPAVLSHSYHPVPHDIEPKPEEIRPEQKTHGDGEVDEKSALHAKTKKDGKDAALVEEKEEVDEQRPTAASNASSSQQQHEEGYQMVNGQGEAEEDGEDAEDEAEEEEEEDDMPPAATRRRRRSHNDVNDNNDEDEEETPEHRMAREALERILGIQLPKSSRPRVPIRRRARPGKKWQRVKKVTEPTEQKTEEGKRIWYMRRHLIGPYGPTLAVKPTSIEETDQTEQENWENYME